MSRSMPVSRSTRQVAKLAEWAKSLGNRGRSKSQHRSLRCEPLEDRRMLSAGAAGEHALELFSTSTALFVENQGQWADEEVRYGFNGDGVNIAFTDDGLAFLLSQTEAVKGTPAAGNWVRPDLPGISSRGAEITAVLESTPAADQRPVSTFPDASSRGADAISPVASSRGADTTTRTTQFTVEFDGANDVTPTGLAQSESRFNYFVGDQSNWASNVPGYEVVAYENLYEGIDLQTFGRRDSLKYEFYVAPSADYSQISVSYDGIDGLWIDKAGALHVETELGELVDDTPYIYQIVGGQEVEVAGQFSLVDADTYTFEITGAYDPNVELVIDPDLDWSSYLGGSSDDLGYGIAVDASGNTLVTGETWSSGWVSGGSDTSLGGSKDAFVVKLSPGGGHVWSSYLGGDAGDSGRGIAVDGSGNVLVTGTTTSSGWVSGGWDTSLGGRSDAFVVKLSPGGGHVWSSYLGGSDEDWGRGIAVDASGNALVTGWTASSGWVSGGWDTSYGGGSGDGFVVKISGAGSIPADFDSDGDVDGDDFLLWQTGFGIPSGANLADGDADGDGDVDGNDFLIWQSNFSTSSGSGSAAALLSEPLRGKRVRAVDQAFDDFGARTRFRRPSRETIAEIGKPLTGLLTNRLQAEHHRQRARAVAR